MCILERLKTKRDFLRNNLEVINEQMAKVTKTDGFPEGPFKKSENQAKVAIKTAINLAKKEGFDGVAMVTGKAKNRGANATGANAKGNLGFYDNIASKAMKVTAKNLDLDFSATNIKDGDGNTYAKIPLITFDKATDTKLVTIGLKPGGFQVSKSLGVKIDPNVAQAPIKPRVVQATLGKGMAIGSTFKIGGAPAENRGSVIASGSGIIPIYETYVPRKSSTLLGNAVKAKISSTYYRSLDINDREGRMY